MPIIFRPRIAFRLKSILATQLERRRIKTMERRNFLLGLAALAAGSATLALSGKADAAPVTAPPIR